MDIFSATDRATAAILIRQFGALAYRDDPERGLQILLVTSRDTGRWVIPRGNPMPRLRGHETAEHEAYEEAGIEGVLSAAPIGRYSYEKKRRSGDATVAEVTVYALRVSRQHYNWPERDQRIVRWFEPRKAALAVDEPELKAIIQSFDPGAIVYAGASGDAKGGSNIGWGRRFMSIIRAIMPKEDRFFDMFDAPRRNHRRRRRRDGSDVRRRGGHPRILPPDRRARKCRRRRHPRRAGRGPALVHHAVRPQRDHRPRFGDGRCARRDVADRQGDHSATRSRRSSRRCWR